MAHLIVATIQVDSVLILSNCTASCIVMLVESCLNVYLTPRPLYLQVSTATSTSTSTATATATATFRATFTATSTATSTTNRHLIWKHQNKDHTVTGNPSWMIGIGSDPRIQLRKYIKPL